MRNAVRITPMRGFSCAIGRTEHPTPQATNASIAIGFDDEGGERTIIIALRHADGSVMTAALGAFQTDRFELMLADARGAPMATPDLIAIPHEVVLQ